MLEIPQARRRVHRRTFSEAARRHLAERRQLYAIALFLLAVAAIILWATLTFPAGQK